MRCSPLKELVIIEVFGDWVRSSYEAQKENQFLLSANLVPESAILQPHGCG